jgi:tRNA-2-methylthio-N6-dimethylallyladenosine synthase
VAKKLFIRTFGCQMNEYDSDKMADVLHASEGLTRTDRPEDADVILFNTCSVRENAQERVFHDLGRMRELKLANPDIVIGVGGCVASQEGAAIVRRAPYVDIVFGPQTLHRLPQLMAARRTSGRAQVDISFPEIEKFDRLPPPRVEGPSAFVSIMAAASTARSVSCPATRRGSVAPVRRRADRDRPWRPGRHEITLLGPERERYRGAMGMSGQAGGDVADLATLLEYVVEVPGVERIRFTTSHPKVTPRLIDAFATIPKLAAHCLPVQSRLRPRPRGDDERGYTVLDTSRSSAACGRTARNLAHVRFHRRLSRRIRRRFRADDEGGGGCRLRRRLQLPVPPAAGNACRRVAGRDAA